MGVDHTPGQTCDFFTAEGKGIAPARWHYSAHGGYPEKACKRRSLGHRDRIRRAMGDMTDVDRILPRLIQKVKRKCPIKRTERRSSWYKHPRGRVVPSADTR